MFKHVSAAARPYMLMNYSCKGYHPVRELMKVKNAKYYSDPAEFGETIVRIVSLHDKVKDPSKVTLGATWEEMGLDSLDYVEILSEVEYAFKYDFGPAEWEGFMNINDIAQFMAKDWSGIQH